MYPYTIFKRQADKQTTNCTYLDICQSLVWRHMVHVYDTIFIYVYEVCLFIFLPLELFIFDY